MAVKQPIGGAPTSGSETSWSDFLEASTKVSVLLAAAGYITTRAHVNSLGIALTESLGLERYLATAWLFIQDLALRAIPVALLVLLLRFLGGFLDRKLQPLLRRMFKRSRQGPASDSGFLLLSVLAVSILASFLTWVKDSGRVDLAMGPVLAQRGYDRPLPTYLFEAALVVLVLGFLVRRKAASQAATVLHRVTWAVLLIITPVIYGVVVHPDQYSLSRITTEAETVCGLLVMQGPESVSVWSVQNGYARTVRWNLDQVKKLEIGPTTSLASQLAELAKVDNPPGTSTAGLCTKL